MPEIEYAGIKISLDDEGYLLHYEDWDETVAGDAAFNARDINGALATMSSDVAWPNGMEGGSVDGHEGASGAW